MCTHSKEIISQILGVLFFNHPVQIHIHIVQGYMPYLHVPVFQCVAAKP